MPYYGLVLEFPFAARAPMRTGDKKKKSLTGAEQGDKKILIGAEPGAIKKFNRQGGVEGKKAAIKIRHQRDLPER
jgi:hypothetical protein